VARVTTDELRALSVVMPVYNEQSWVRTSIEALLRAGAAAGLTLDVVVVDDGSTDATPAVLSELAARTGIRVLTQINSGRLAARAAGLAAAHEPFVLLLDSRVVIRERSLAWLKDQVAEHPERRVWNGHVDVETRRNTYAAYWSGLVKIGWRRYTANPRLVSFGAEDFDYYPKGTGCLFVPRDLLVDATAGFGSLFDNPKLSNDDTRLLRDVAARERFWISPEFAFTYHGKAGLRGFRRQSYFRGTTFIDGYLGRAGAVRRALLAALLGAVVVAAVTVFAPLVGLACVLAVLLATPVVVRLVGGSWYEIRAAALLTPVFIPVFGAGILRGLSLAAATAVRSKYRPRSAVSPS
jgi:glycosyltransferase involved in cell wall biosynthesis